MARRPVTIPVRVESLAYELGHWCRSCLLPSGVRTWLVVSYGPGMHMRVEAWCDDCGSRDIDVDQE